MVDRPPIRTTSPVDGLGRGRLTFVQVLAQSISAVAPSAVMVTLPALVIPEAGTATIAVFAAAAILMTLVGYSVGQFAQRMVAVSGLYSYAAKGLGAVPGFGAGWSLIVGYAAAAMASVVGAASYSSALLSRVGVPTGTATTAIAAAAVGLIALALMIRGVRISTRVTLAVEVFAIIAATAVLAVAFVHAVGDSPSGSDPPGEHSSNIGFALLLAITSFVGFESASTVAREARNPLTAIPRAVKWTPLALGILYVGAAAAQMQSPIEQSSGLAIVLSLPDTAGGASAALSILMELGITASWFACVLGSTTALSRTLFAMGREGVMPSALGRTHARFHTPHIALLASVPVIVVVPIVYLLSASSSRDVLLGLLTVSAHGYVIAYISVCIAAPLFLRKIGELSRMPLLAGAAAASMLTALVVWATWSRTFVAGSATAAYVLLLVLGYLIFFLRARPGSEVRARVGVYDETTASDLLVGYRPWEVRK
ncbi:APC family permease [Rhodococcus sp. G-MC3]|uniref:APC family permease n=1 Tax=Rhodococcus sp. G-MC3 TaxID=3046209 RepID=UPI0024BBAA92|nr:APC family permease [Rhodococcus sp. G-MC3]MDJ0396415.1 APC family permease [Rhodococcus sp. G-MC3]